MPHRLRLFCLALLLCASVHAQSVTINKTALLQTRLIQTTKGIGTAFAVEVDHREYWITAKHIFSGIENAPPGTFTAKSVQANVLFPFAKINSGSDQRWANLTFTPIDPGKDIDILVLVPEKSITKGLPPDTMKLAADTDPNADNAILPIGGNCEFLGYPYGGGWKANIPIYTLKNGSKTTTPITIDQLQSTTSWFWSPFAKHCTLSGSITQNGITVLVLDGIDNLGFSGGPVVTSHDGVLDVIAIVSSFRAEPLEVLPAPAGTQAYVSPIPPPSNQKSKQQKEVVESNSGLILAYDIAPAIKAIHDHPIGPSLIDLNKPPTK